MENKENNKVKNGKMTLDKLAVMVARGFDKTATKEETATKEDFNNLKGEIGKMKKDIGMLKFKVDDTYDILQRFEENDILNLQKRVQILEKSVRSMSKQLG